MTYDIFLPGKRTEFEQVKFCFEYFFLAGGDDVDDDALSSSTRFITVDFLV